MKTRPEMTDEEIRSYMDFDQLLEMHKKTPVHRGFFDTRYLLILGLAVGIGIFSWTMISDKETSGEQSQSPEGKNDQLSDVKNQTAISDSTTNHIVDESATQPEKSKTQTVPLKPTQDRELNKKAEQTLPHDSASENANAQSEKSRVNLVYVQAAPVRGYPDLYEYFNRELRYPHEALKDSIQGEVTAVFTINTQGLPEKILIENSLGAAFDNEVVRLITNMPLWKPATYNEKPVASKMSLPLTFQIKKIPSQK